MKAPLCSFSFCVIAFLSAGCGSVVSVHPLYTAEDEKRPYRDARLEGDWIMADEDEGGSSEPWHVTVGRPPSEPGNYTVEFRGKDSSSDPAESYFKYEFHLVPLNGGVFFDAEFDEMKGHASIRDSDIPSGFAPAHLLGQVWVQQDFVRFTGPQGDWIKENWPANDLVSDSLGEDNTVLTLTNPTSDLRERLSRAEGAFRDSVYLCRVGADCNARAVEDELVRLPNDYEALEGAVKFFSKRGNFSRAIGLQKHKIELNPGAPRDQLELAQLLFLRRDFAGARRALVAANEPSNELFVRSYFLEGDYAGTVQAAKARKVPDKDASADPILLCYFALYRLGRAKEAESYFRERIASFSGPGSEHLFLLEVAGRLTTLEIAAKDNDRRLYYSALNYARQNKIKGCADFDLKQLITNHPKNDPLSLAAQIELDRLGAPARK
ncbi:MAG TPA: hypothetical protein VFN26_19165 [Candidatus Acidoferrum sp.]|nr:hypothetical protein [Candidatus Acidoferrum sp.]